MAHTIITGEGTTFLCPERSTAPVSRRKTDREWVLLTLITTHAAAVTAFVDGAALTHEWDSQVRKPDGTIEVQTINEDLSDYCVAGDIVDHRDGTVTVYMSKPTETEVLRKRVTELETEKAALEKQVKSK